MNETSKNAILQQPVLVTGATGYVGGRLIPELLLRGFRVRAMGRSMSKLRVRSWAKDPSVELVAADVLDSESLLQAVRGCDAVYYLVHSMLPGQKNFSRIDREAACNMRRAAEECGVRRIIYLSGLGEDDPALSKHLKSRAEVADELKQGKVPVTVLRAAMIIGAGSASFEILRYLVERLPVMITPKWLETPSQPIAIRNVIEYLAGCLEKDETSGNTYDIGGSEVVTYHQLMTVYAEEAKLAKRVVIPVPVLTPWLSSYWIHLVTPVSAAIARPLAEGLRNPVVCRDDRIKKIITQDLLSPRAAIRASLDAVEIDQVETHWTDAGGNPPVEGVYAGDPVWSGGTLLKDVRTLESHAPAEEIWNVICRIGGKTGWYHADRLWRFRGFLDKLFGGVGLRRGRRNGERLYPGDVLDFWRVLAVDPQARIFLLAEMRLPGKATLEFKIDSLPGGKTKLTQSALFSPRGLWGIVYWYFLLPFHHYIFSGMIRKIALRAEAQTEQKRLS